MKTHLTIDGERFLINNRPVYSEIPGSDPKMHGLLMNARFIQGIFDDKAAPERFNRFGRSFDPERNTDALIAALGEWYRFGLRAFTVGMQGGGPCFTMSNDSIDNNPFSPDGTQIDARYLARLERLLLAADELGMAVIVSILYCGQIHRLDGADGVRNAIRTTARWLRQRGFCNVILEPANEYDIPAFRDYPSVNTHQGMVELIELAKSESGMPVGCSGGGGCLNREVARASDVVLIHGNGQPRQALANLILRARSFAPGKPILCNEDSQALSNLQVCADHYASWGYYNNLTKQEPPTDWRILEGEDAFFAQRMAACIGIDCPTAGEDPIRLVGIAANECTDGKCWPRIAALYPERIDHVDFYFDGEWLYRCYDDPHTLYYGSNWQQSPLLRTSGTLRAVVTMTDGETIVREGQIGI